MNYIIIIAGFLILIAVIVWIVLGKRVVKESGPGLYVEALNAMLEGRDEEAVDKLKQIVKTDTENIMAYIYLGDMLRKQGSAVRASKVHRNLLVRNNLNTHQLNMIMHRLILDYKEAGMPDKAAEVAERIIRNNKHDYHAKELLLSLYEEKKDWDKAFFHRQNLNRWMKKKDQDILALYKVMAGIEQITDSREREGRIRFREAIKLDRSCVPAYLHWSDSYRRTGRNEDALRVLKDFIHQNPEWAHLAFDRLKILLYNLGRYGEIEHLYASVIRKKPKRPDVYLVLIDLYLKEGRFDQALDLVQKTIDQYPDNGLCRLMLVKVYRRMNKDGEALAEAASLLEKTFKKNDLLVCSNCGYETSDPMWWCPGCHHWKTFLKE